MQMVDNGDDTVNMEDVFRTKRHFYGQTDYQTGRTLDELPKGRMEYERVKRANIGQGKHRKYDERSDGTEELRARLLAKKNSLSSINTLARYALMALKPRSTMCLYRALCLGNKRIRYMRNSTRYWLPVWQ